MIKPGMSIDGFTVKDVTPLEEYRGTGITAVHEKTGCEVFHVQCDDRDNLFAFTFKTLPRDDTGVAHILEHTVLSGSEKYPVKDPFLLLLKGSMNTFLNAMTFPDKTVYPASSTVEKDLFNLMKVYGDAVFFPLLKSEMFSQEGHRIEVDETGKLHKVGIVYNEMQGNYASHDSIASDWAVRSLFPDTVYHHDSGGDPAHIDELTYEQFIEFHKTYYHPSNTKIFLYGNIPTEKYLSFLNNEFLSRFTRRSRDNEVPIQPRWSEPRTQEVAYPVEPDSTVAGKSSITVNWLLPPVTDAETALSLELLSEILLGNSGSPLKKALIDSGLGEDLSPPTGMETDLRELVFSAGIRGTDPDKQKELEDLIFSVLSKLASDGIDPDILEAALRTFEFRHREIKSHFGLRLMRRSLRGWLHGETPVHTMVFARHMQRIRSLVNSGGSYFEELIKKYLIDNPHRTTLIVQPDPEMADRERKDTETELANISSRMTKSELEELKERQKKLAEYQQTPDKKEDAAKIPSLHADDLPRQVEKIPSEQQSLGDTPVYTHEFYTNRILYVEFLFDVTGLDDTLSWFLPALGASVTGTGLPGKPYDQIARELSLLTGGFGTHLETATTLKDNQPKGYLSFRMRMLDKTAEESIRLLGSLLAEADFNDQNRIKDILLEMRSDFTSAVMPSGHSFVNHRIARCFSLAERTEERWKGISQLFFLHSLDFSKSVDMFCSVLKALRKRTMTRENLLINVTGESDMVRSALPLLEEAAQMLPRKSSEDDISASLENISLRGAMKELFTGGSPDIDKINKGESLIIPSNVGYVGFGIPGKSYLSREYPYEYLLAHLLKTGFLWEAIRMQGGAYGAFAASNGLEQMFTYASYRDPNIVPTLEAFKASLRSAGNDTDLEESLRLAKIGTVGRDTRPMSPAEKGAVAFRRALYGISDELRQQKREILLDAEAHHIRETAEQLSGGLNNGYFSVMAGKEALSSAYKDYPQLKEGVFNVPQ
ncbi:MAG: insulinase family protein [Spirochaetia bacterium]